MDTRYIAVVGLNYGDEGKGRMTNYLANEGSLVARYSGSAQAAHTVTEGGKRHVFKHFGSGTMRGADTLLTEGFLCHPVEFRTEDQRLSELGVAQTRVLVDERCPVILPTDMIINQALENMRGDSKHGSCGMGVRQAVERCAYPTLRTTAREMRDLSNTSRLLPLMVRHLETFGWMNSMPAGRLLFEAGVKDLTAVAERFQEDVAYFNARTELCSTEEMRALMLRTDTMILEGSQGLAIDPSVGKLPYLTPTYVGLGGLLPVFRETFTGEIEMMYVTRPYLTRHGAGPLPGEGDWPLELTDETNVPNKWQDTLRYAPLNFQLMAHRAGVDSRWVSLWPWPEVKLTISLAVTCLDQVEHTDFPFVDLSGREKSGVSAFLNECDNFIDTLSSIGEWSGRGRLITCFGEDRVDTHESREVGGVQVA